MTKSESEIVDQIRCFLSFSAKSGYSNEQNKTVTEKDKSHTICVEKDDFKLHDNYFGGGPYGGREVILKNDKPVWMMVYYGSVYKETSLEIEDIYKFLRKNLLNPDKNMPIRGPLQNTEGKWRYNLDIKGDLANFVCFEEIFYGSEEVYKATFAGGLVEQHG